VSVLTALKDLTGGIGPDACIDAVGLEAHSADLQGVYEKVKVALLMETDRPSVLRQAIQAVRKSGTLSVPGVYGGMLDKVPFGAAFGKGITMKMGQTNIHNYIKPLLNELRRAKLIRATSSRTELHWSRRPICTKYGVTRQRTSPRSLSIRGLRP
jgi:threonine dehydrogenase-like Zn-dependent dehydrogenase